MFATIAAIAMAGAYYSDYQDKTEKTHQILTAWTEEFVNGDIKKALDEYPNDAWGKRIWFSNNHAISKAPFGDIIVPFPPKKIK